MARFSEEARRAARAAKLLAEQEPTTAEPEPAFPRELPKFVPLDRNRKVPVVSMGVPELLEAREQARRRVERTKHSSDLERYKLMLESIEAELSTRGTEMEIEVEMSTRPEDHAPEFVETPGEVELPPDEDFVERKLPAPPPPAKMDFA